MGKIRRSAGSWRYQVIKGYKRRAQKFREEAKNVEEKIAWLKVNKWFETILDHRQMNDNDTIILPHVKLEDLDLRARAREDVRVEAEAHWDYTDKIIKDMLRLVRTAYVEAFVHGFKHGKREAEGDESLRC